MTIASTVKNYLTSHHVAYELVSHYKTESSHETAQAAHVMDDHIAKAVVVKDMHGYAMAVIPGSDWLKLKALRDEVGREFELVNEAEVFALFNDCQAGAVPPLGQAYDIETFLDERLSTLANVFFEAGDHENLVHVNGNAFHELFKGVRHGHFSHDDS